MTFNQLFQDGRRPFEIDHTAAADRSEPELGVEIEMPVGRGMPVTARNWDSGAPRRMASRQETTASSAHSNGAELRRRIRIQEAVEAVPRKSQCSRNKGRPKMMAGKVAKRACPLWVCDQTATTSKVNPQSSPSTSSRRRRAGRGAGLTSVGVTDCEVRWKSWSELWIGKIVGGERQPEPIEDGDLSARGTCPWLKGSKRPSRRVPSCGLGV